jgi:hypothetical protein
MSNQLQQWLVSGWVNGEVAMLHVASIADSARKENRRTDRQNKSPIVEASFDPSNSFTQVFGKH